MILALLLAAPQTFDWDSYIHHTIIVAVESDGQNCLIEYEDTSGTLRVAITWSRCEDLTILIKKTSALRALPQIGPDDETLLKMADRNNSGEVLTVWSADSGSFFVRGEDGAVIENSFAD